MSALADQLHSLHAFRTRHAPKIISSPLLLHNLESLLLPRELWQRTGLSSTHGRRRRRRLRHVDCSRHSIRRPSPSATSTITTIATRLCLRLLPPLLRLHRLRVKAHLPLQLIKLGLLRPLPCLNRRRRRGSTRAAQQASAVACSACVPLAAPGRSGGRARGGTGLGAGLAPLRLHLQVLRVDRALASSQLPRLQGVDVAAAVPPQPAEPRGAGPLCAGAAEARAAARRVRRAPHSPEGPPAPPSSPCNTCGLSPRTALQKFYKGL